MVSSKEFAMVVHRLIAARAPKASSCLELVFLKLVSKKRGIRYKFFPGYYSSAVFHEQVMIACVLMVTFLDDFEFLNHYDLLDFFAGAGRMARGGRVLGYHGAAFDISYHPNSRVFDINSDAGFACL